MRTLTSAVLLVAALAPGLTAQSAPAPISTLGLRDIFELEWAAEPQIAPDGRRVVFERGGYDVMKDRARSTLWIVNADGTELRPLVDPTREASSPRWSPDGSRVLYVSSVGDKADLFVRWMDTGQEAKLTHLEESPRGVVGGGTCALATATSSCCRRPAGRRASSRTARGMTASRGGRRTARRSSSPPSGSRTPTTSR